METIPKTKQICEQTKKLQMQVFDMLVLLGILYRVIKEYNALCCDYV
jgi:hypothetical protein